METMQSTNLSRVAFFGCEDPAPTRLLALRSHAQMSIALERSESVRWPRGRKRISKRLLIPVTIDTEPRKRGFPIKGESSKQGGFWVPRYSVGEYAGFLPLKNVPVSHP